MGLFQFFLYIAYIAFIAYIALSYPSLTEVLGWVHLILTRKHIPVDVFGECGNKNCDQHKKGCHQYLEDNYKFYLSFENALCTDYVTEKLYRTLSLDLVPVVMGRADYSHFAPPGSYIDIADFASPALLAKELWRRSEAEEYCQHFWWKVGGGGWPVPCSGTLHSGQVQWLAGGLV